ncbi:MAG TPA: hypothetical protein PLD47_05270 [Aggregatilineales bacterium]|nr:hypothetical protein [Anaerolineales bacterium]HRE47115.1 hypothetical protein [Aggregatilineales bacterium]
MGILYYAVVPEVLQEHHTLITAHEGEVVGPRARGYWSDYPEAFDYEAVQAVAQGLAEIGAKYGTDRLELSEVAAHSLSLLEITVPADDQPFPPQLFLTSLPPAAVRLHLTFLAAALGDDPDAAVRHIRASSRDPRYAAFLRKQVRRLRETLPTVWRFHERACAAGQGVLVIDLRARDLVIPDALERLGWGN